jgi:hypothetical protein
MVITVGNLMLSNEVWLYKGESEMWKRSKVDLSLSPVAREGHSAVAYGADKMIVFGGEWTQAVVQHLFHRDSLYLPLSRPWFCIGMSQNYIALKDTWVYKHDDDKPSWTEVIFKASDPVPSARWLQSSCAMGTNMYVFGGSTMNGDDTLLIILSRDYTCFANCHMISSYHYIQVHLSTIYGCLICQSRNGTRLPPSLDILHHRDGLLLQGN